MRRGIVRASAVLLAALAWGALVPGSQAQQTRGTPTLAIVTTEIKNSPLGPAEEPVGNLMDQVIVSLFEGAGFRTHLVDNPSGDWLSDQELARIGRSAGAQWVVYPKILVMASAPLQPGQQAYPDPHGTRAVLYTRIVNATARRYPATSYMRQVAPEWETPTANLAAYGEANSLPMGVVQLFEFFRPLNQRLAARGLPSIWHAPLRVTQAIWPEERVAGYRESIQNP
ncbi:MAG: hypothetical protein HY320_00055 [Armatimonadetes bacterium]|nr:hypothetical protein [Armatimonadota bacterium]